ncbi:nickel pincer cofactor biosynthesis protein LarB [Xanthobacteraceae bacterium Astr-EGSB]|uniref:nickel pincer cofactor biosynthesis protein LarB n=1 Tax=Astrobacterium formosum TaxID=3069710 RepID=UPI0027B090A1|nr:nickel pincer cofactor biosynthesis protein LarB [Xanthobacteraceae bacterium Astr-EGSB]
MNEFELDWERLQRTGIGEAIFCHGKSPPQIDAILAAAGQRTLLLTRLDEPKFALLHEESRRRLDYDPLSRTAFHEFRGESRLAGPGIVCAGTSDLPVAREAARTLEFYGYDSPIIADVGVAGLWRLLRRLEDIRRFRVVIVIAGMEGSLFSVVAGLVDASVIAVPVSVGYGVAADGRAALNSALASCAAGLVSVNIDNGFGAACAAVRILQGGPPQALR